MNFSVGKNCLASNPFSPCSRIIFSLQCVGSLNHSIHLMLLCPTLAFRNPMWPHKSKSLSLCYTVCALCEQQLASFTLIFDLAEVSKKAQLFHWRARFWPCSLPTTRSSSKSHLFPTRIIGTWKNQSTNRDRGRIVISQLKLNFFSNLYLGNHQGWIRR